jgi:hypothetical protein
MMEQRQTNEITNLEIIEGNPGTNELNEAWREVGSQFQLLGLRLAAALQRSWAASGSQEASEVAMRNLRDDLRIAADRVDHAIRDASEATVEDRTATLRATRRASEQSLEEARILTAATLRKLNRQLDHLVARLEEEEHEIR